ncbi:MAG: hypothetical protein M1816_003056 [Peltula sp. TS41687]|nr:MAG: hypothetical protein M1816_003056 [Peltula sp. TS41687]
MAHQAMPIDLAAVIPTFIGSALSALGAGFILVCYALLPQQGHFRHALIINLAVADFINALNNSISGGYMLSKKHNLVDGSSCVANGFIKQLSVQGMDCSILVIAVITLLSVKKKMMISDASTLAKCAVCGVVWILPVSTSYVHQRWNPTVFSTVDADGMDFKGLTALGLGLYHPVSGNWCWIEEKPAHLRYVLTYGWRFLFIVLSVIIYTYLYLYLHYHFKRIRSLRTSQRPPPPSLPTTPHHKWADDGLLSKRPALKMSSFSTSSTGSSSVCVESQKDLKSPEPPTSPGVMVAKTICQESYVPSINNSNNPSSPVEPICNAHLAATEACVKKTLLLNAYPIMYIILWIPGIANRIVEATGSSSRPLTILQASTQYIGLANAITYGLNERVVGQLREKFWRAGSSDAR